MTTTTITNAHGVEIRRPQVPNEVTATTLARSLARYAKARVALLEARKANMVDPATVGGAKYQVPNFTAIETEWRESKEAEELLGALARCKHINGRLTWAMANQLVDAGAQYNFTRLRTSTIRYLGAIDDQAEAGRPRDARGRFVKACPACQGGDADHIETCPVTLAAQAAGQAAEIKAERRNEAVLAGEL